MPGKGIKDDSTDATSSNRPLKDELEIHASQINLTTSSENPHKVESGAYNFDLDVFIRDNYRLFTVMGVFGAIAIYLTRLEGSVSGVNPLLLNLGILSSLTIFSLVAYYITKNCISIFESRLDFILSIFELKNTNMMVFLISFYILSGSIIGFALSFPKALSTILKFVSGLLGISIYFSILGKISPYIVDEENDKTFAIFIGAGSILSVFISSGALLAIVHFYGYRINKILNPESGNVLVEVLSSMLLGSLTASLLMTAILIISLIYIGFSNL